MEQGGRSKVESWREPNHGVIREVPKREGQSGRDKGADRATGVGERERRTHKHRHTQRGRGGISALHTHTHTHEFKGEERNQRGYTNNTLTRDRRGKMRNKKGGGGAGGKISKAQKLQRGDTQTQSGRETEAERERRCRQELRQWRK